MLFLETVYRLMNRYNQRTKAPKRYGTEDLLYPAEVHLMEVIGSEDGITTTQLAQRLAITKGAVSQTTSRLMEKELIHRQPAPGQRREMLFTLTTKGGVVFRHHRQMHQRMLERIEDIWQELLPESRTALQEMMMVLEEALDEMEEAEK